MVTMSQWRTPSLSSWGRHIRRWLATLNKPRMDKTKSPSRPSKCPKLTRVRPYMISGNSPPKDSSTLFKGRKRRTFLANQWIRKNWTSPTTLLWWNDRWTSARSRTSLKKTNTRTCSTSSTTWSKSSRTVASTMARRVRSAKLDSNCAKNIRNWPRNSQSTSTKSDWERDYNWEIRGEISFKIRRCACVSVLRWLSKKKNLFNVHMFFSLNFYMTQICIILQGKYPKIIATPFF